MLSLTLDDVVLRCKAIVRSSQASSLFIIFRYRHLIMHRALGSVFRIIDDRLKALRGLMAHATIRFQIQFLKFCKP